MTEASTIDRPVAAASAPTLEDLLLHHEVSQFLFREACMQDEHEFDAWEALWAEDGVYWVPANGYDEIDPETEMSIVYDNRSRIALRIRQLKTGRRWAQEPRSGLRRTVSNVEATALENGEISVAANGTLFEAHPRGNVVWSYRAKYVLRRVDGVLKVVRKTVLLPNNDQALWSMAFLI